MSSLLLRKPDAILFDWDGTLVDTLPAIHSYYNHTLAAFGMEQMTLDQAKARIRKSAREVFPEIFGDQSDKAIEIYFSKARESHLDFLKEIEGAGDFIAELHALNIPMAVVSNKRDEFLQREVNNIGWGDKLRFGIGAGVAAKDKPSPDPLWLAIERLGLNHKTDHVWYVGDTETDMQAALAAGCAPIFIEHGLATRDDCVRVGVFPQYVENYVDFLRLVENLPPKA